MGERNGKRARKNEYWFEVDSDFRWLVSTAQPISGAINCSTYSRRGELIEYYYETIWCGIYGKVFAKRLFHTQIRRRLSRYRTSRSRISSGCSDWSPHLADLRYARTPQGACRPCTSQC